MKAIVEMGYVSYVLDADKALQIIELLEGAERYQEKYRGSGVDTTLHVYTDETDKVKHLKLLSNNMYNLAKLAGKPEEK